jgi:hypothetical protein
LFRELVAGLMILFAVMCCGGQMRMSGLLVKLGRSLV